MIDMMNRKEDEGRWVYIGKREGVHGAEMHGWLSEWKFFSSWRDCEAPPRCRYSPGWPIEVAGDGFFFVTARFEIIAFRCTRT